MAFVGVLNGSGPYNAIVELQARYAAAVLSQSLPRPSDKVMHDGIEKDRRRREKSPFHTAVQMSDICEELGDELGVTPSYWQAIRDPKRLLLGPQYPCSYRLDPTIEGEKKAAQCRAVFDEYTSNPEKAEF